MAGSPGVVTVYSGRGNWDFGANSVTGYILQQIKLLAFGVLLRLSGQERAGQSVCKGKFGDGIRAVVKKHEPLGKPWTSMT